MAMRGESGLSGVLGIDKAAGISSHSIVNRVRQILGERRVGHAGTLDPLATGVLPVCVGPATRLNSYLSGQSKAYRFSVCFGAQTDTDDCAGTVIAEASVPDEVFDPFFARDFVAGLVGEHEQVPPAYSAIKVEGKRAYARARRGESFEMKARGIEIFAARLETLQEPNVRRGSSYPSWRISVDVSKGTYIRSLARDIGEALGCPAHVGSLERTRVGNLKLADCVELDELSELAAKGEEAIPWLDPVGLLDVPAISLDGQAARIVCNGGALLLEGLSLSEGFRLPEGFCLPEDSAKEEPLVACLVLNRLKALYRYDRGRAAFIPDRVFSTGVFRG